MSATTDVSEATLEPAVVQRQLHSLASPTLTAGWPASSLAHLEPLATDCYAEGPEFRARSAIAGTARRPWS